MYGQAKYLQAWLEERDVFYVMAIRRSDTLTTTSGEQRADALIAAAPARSWQRISVGAGAHDLRESHWARVPVRPGSLWPRALAAGPPIPPRPRRDRLLRLLRSPPWSWSTWRRKRQHQARLRHYPQRGYVLS